MLVGAYVNKLLVNMRLDFEDWSVIKIQADIARVYDKGSPFDNARKAIFEKLAPPEPKPEVDGDAPLAPTAEELAEKARKQAELEEEATREFDRLLATEVELDFLPLTTADLERMSGFSAMELGPIRWLFNK